MTILNIFTDGSVSTKSRVGYGAYLATTDLSIPVETLKQSVKLKRFEPTSSTRLELQTLLWALGDVTVTVTGDDVEYNIYTDSQNIMGLPARRKQLEINNFYSRNNKRLNQHQLYKEFYRLTLTLNYRFKKVTGHRPSGEKNAIDRIFALVDKASRHALRSNSTVQKQ